MLCCGYTLTAFPISTRLTSLALWQSNNCPSAGKATHMNMDKYFMWNHYERLHNHNKAKHNKNVCIFLGIYCSMQVEVAILGSIISFSSNCNPSSNLPCRQLAAIAFYLARHIGGILYGCPSTGSFVFSLVVYFDFRALASESPKESLHITDKDSSLY